MIELLSILKNEFNLDEYLKPPFVIFFQTAGEEITDYFIIKLKQERLEEAFIELKNHIKNGVEAISKVANDYTTNHKEIFRLLRGGVEGGKAYEFLRNKVISKIGIGTLISFVKVIATGKIN